MRYFLIVRSKVINKTFKDTQREKTPSNETPALTKCMSMDIWVFGTSNKLFRRVSYSETKFSKK